MCRSAASNPRSVGILSGGWERQRCSTPVPDLWQGVKSCPTGGVGAFPPEHADDAAGRVDGVGGAAPSSQVGSPDTRSPRGIAPERGPRGAPGSSGRDSRQMASAMAASLLSPRQRAHECYSQGDLQSAHRALLALLNRDPGDAETLNDLGTVSFSLGQLDDSERYYARAWNGTRPGVRGGAGEPEEALPAHRLDGAGGRNACRRDRGRPAIGRMGAPRGLQGGGGEARAAGEGSHAGGRRERSPQPGAQGFSRP